MPGFFYAPNPCGKANATLMGARRAPFLESIDASRYKARKPNLFQEPP